MFTQKLMWAINAAAWGFYFFIDMDEGYINATDGLMAIASIIMMNIS